uniref:Uncharacterized protein n=1 Tax=Rhizophora mucronata TaxID=61149 RepID=A0A2P2LLT9_RHIMU
MENKGIFMIVQYVKTSNFNSPVDSSCLTSL